MTQILVLFLFAFFVLFCTYFMLLFFSALSDLLQTPPLLGDHVEEIERENETTQHGAVYGAITWWTVGVAVAGSGSGCGKSQYSFLKVVSTCGEVQTSSYIVFMCNFLFKKMLNN